MKMYGSQMAERFYETAWGLKRMEREIARNRTCDEDDALAKDIGDMIPRIMSVLQEPFDPCPKCDRRPLVTFLWTYQWNVCCPTCQTHVCHSRYTRAVEEWNEACREDAEDA